MKKSERKKETERARAKEREKTLWSRKTQCGLFLTALSPSKIYGCCFAKNNWEKVRGKLESAYHVAIAASNKADRIEGREGERHARNGLLRQKGEKCKASYIVGS